MNFVGVFTCEKCGKEFTLSLGSQWQAENKTKKRFVESFGLLGQMMAASCREHEIACEGTRKVV
jgi:hypothetical protein